jgi:hypothetical protein
VEKAGYETAWVSPIDRAERDGDVRLQRKIEINAGETVVAALYADDPPYSDAWGENSCRSCKLIRVTTLAGGILNLELKVLDGNAGAGLILDSQGGSASFCCYTVLTKSLHVSGRLNVMVYTDPVSDTPVKFSLSTALR